MESKVRENNQMNNEITIEKSNELLSNNEFLPIGTVVLLKNSERKIMIIGLLQIDGSNNASITYDYSGVLYPEGLIDPKKNYLFNKEQIERIYFVGYHNEEQDKLQQAIKQVLDKHNQDKNESGSY